MQSNKVQAGLIKKLSKAKEAVGPLVLIITSIRVKDNSTVLEFTDNEDKIKGAYKGVLDFAPSDIVIISKYSARDIGTSTVLNITEISKYAPPDTKHKAIPSETVCDSPPKMQSKKTDENPDEKAQKQASSSNGDCNEELDYIPISHLMSNMGSFVIKGRVIEKYEVRSFSNTKGPGKIFRFEVADKDSSIELVCFNEAVDKFMNIIEKDHIYKFKNGLIKMANKKFTAVKNDLSIILDKNSEIIPCSEDNDFKFGSFNFTTLKEIGQIEGAYDIIVIIVSDSEPSEIITKKGDKMIKKTITFTDESKIKAYGSLWRESAKEVFQPNSIVAFKGVIYKKFGTKLNFNIQSNNIIREIKHPRAQQLKKYLSVNTDNLIDASLEGKSESLSSVRACIQDIIKKSEAIDTNTIYNIIADITMISTKKLYYIGCPTCKKKVNEEGSSYKCEKCNKLISVPVVTLMMSIKVMDHTGSMYASLFGEKGEKLFKVKAEEIKGYKDNQEDAKIRQKFDSVKFKTYEFGIVAKKPFVTANTNEKMSYSIIFFNEVNYDKENSKMLADVKSMVATLKV